MHNPRRLKLGSVLTKLRNNLITIHVRNPAIDRIFPQISAKYPAAGLSFPQLLHVWQAQHRWKRAQEQGSVNTFANRAGATFPNWNRISSPTAFLLTSYFNFR